MKILAIVLALIGGISHAQINVVPVQIPHQTLFDQSGSPCAGCSLFTYLAGTTTSTPTFTDASGASQNTNPIVLNTAGSANIWVSNYTALKLVLKDTLGSTVWTVDNVFPGDVTGAWSSTTTYNAGQFVTYSGKLYASLVNANINHQPDTSPTQWALISSAPTTVSGLGVTTLSQLQAQVTACGIDNCTIVVSGSIVFSQDYTVPANASLIFSGGKFCPNSGVTLTVAGPITSANSQIFCGAGTVNGLIISRPEWFGAGATVTMAAAALAQGGQVLLSANNYPAGSALVKSNIFVIGSGQALYNVGNTAFTSGSGSIVQGNLSIKGSSLTFKNFSIDNGSALGTCTDGLTVSSGGIAQPILLNVTVDRVSTLLCTPTTAFHSILIEGVNGAAVSNVQTINGIYGVVLKCQNCTAQHVVSMAHSQNCFLVKSDNVFAVAAYVDADDVRCFSLTPGDTGPAMIQGAAALAQKVSFRNFKLNNMNGTALQLFAFALSGVNGTVADVDVDNLVIDTVPSGTGVVTVADSTSNIFRFHLNSPTINNTNVPILLGAPAAQIEINNAILTNATSDGINNFATTASFFNTNCWNVTGGCIHDHTGLPAVKVFGINVQPPSGGIGGGPPFIDNNGVGQPNISGNYLAGNAPLVNVNGLYKSGQSVTVSALATATCMQGTGTSRGLLRISDETFGGSGGTNLYDADPNGGVQMINATSQITGITGAAEITLVSGQWCVTLASGAVPRTISWTFNY